MPSLARVLGSPGLSDQLLSMNEVPDDAVVERLHLVESLGDASAAPPRAVVLTTQAACRGLRDYEIDVALRRAFERDVSALVLFGVEFTRLPTTAAALA